MGRTESLNRRKFHDRFYLAFKENRQNHDVRRMKFAEAGTHFRVVVRYISQKNASFFQRRLSHEALTHFEAVLRAIAFL